MATTTETLVIKVDAEGVDKLDQLGDKTKNIGRGFLEMSRAFEDAQYGIRGVLNNIPQMVMMFGGPAGLAAAISATAVATTILVEQFGPLIEKFTGVDTAAALLKGTIGTLKDEIAKLEKQPLKMAVDAEQLDEAKRKLAELEKAEAAWKAAHESTAAAAKESGAVFAETLAETEGGEGAVVDKLTDIMVQERAANDEAIRGATARKQAAEAELAELSKPERQIAAGMAGPGASEALSRQIEAQKAQVAAQANVIKAARDKLVKDVGLEVGGVVGAAKLGKQEAQDRLVGMLTGVAPDELVSALADASADVLGKFDAAGRAFDLANEKARLARERRARARAEVVAAIDAANKAEAASIEEGQELARNAAAADKKAADDRDAAAKKEVHDLKEMLKQAEDLNLRRQAAMIQRAAPEMVGVRLSPEQARGAAEESFRLLPVVRAMKPWMDAQSAANEATLMAMQNAVQAMAGMIARAQAQEAMAIGLNGAVNQMNGQAWRQTALPRGNGG